MHPAPGIHVEWVDDEAVALDTTTNRLHYLNPPAALVYALILEHGYQGALDRLSALMHEGKEVREDLPELIGNMVELGLLVESRGA